HFDRLRRDVDTTRALDTMDKFQAAAYELTAGSKSAELFNLSREDAKTRDMYGRTSWGQSALLARRLVEAGCTFVTVHCGGWDHHWDLKAGMDRYLPQVDQMVSGLFEDLHQRGLAEKVLVMMMGEFGRTPKMNDGGNGGAPMSMGTPGRDHWGNALCCLIGGGGVKGGRVIGSTDRLRTRPHSPALTPPDNHPPIFQMPGIHPEMHPLEPT